MIAMAKANFSRPSAPGRSPRFQLSSGPMAVSAISGRMMGMKVAL